MQHKFECPCPVCLVDFSIQNPAFILDCGHNVCENDLRKLQKYSDGFVLCPKCNKKSNKKAIKNFELNSVIDEAVTIIDQLKNCSFIDETQETNTQSDDDENS